MWIAKNDDEEYVQDLLIERKTPTDLVRSIKKASKEFPPLTRVKVRHKKMKSSGIQNKIYLVEGNANVLGGPSDLKRFNTYINKDLKALEQEGVKVKRTKGFQETIYFLVELSRQVKDNVRLNPPIFSSVTFDAVAKRIKDELNDPHFRWNLELQGIPRVGPTRADLVSEAYPTNESLLAACRERGGKDIERVLSQMRMPGGRALGAAAKSILERFCPMRACNSSTAATPHAIQGHGASGTRRIHSQDTRDPRFPSQLNSPMTATAGLHHDDTTEWIKCLKGLGLKRLGPEKVGCIVGVFETEESLRTAFRNDPAETKRFIASLKTMGDRSVGPQVAQTLCAQFGPGRLSTAEPQHDTPSPVATLPQSAAFHHVNVITPESNSTNYAKPAFVDAHYMKGNLKDDATYDTDGDATLETALRQRMEEQRPPEGMQQLQLDARGKGSATCAEFPDQKQMALTNVELAEKMLNETRKKSMLDEMKVSHDVYDVDTKETQQMEVAADPLASSRLAWLNSPENAALALDVIQGAIKANGRIAVTEVVQLIDNMFGFKPTAAQCTED